MEFCCELFNNHFNEGFLKEERYFISGEEDVPSEKRHFFAEASAYDEVESKTTKIPLNYCPFVGKNWENDAEANGAQVIPGSLSYAFEDAPASIERNPFFLYKLQI